MALEKWEKQFFTAILVLSSTVCLMIYLIHHNYSTQEELDKIRNDLETTHQKLESLVTRIGVFQYTIKLPIPVPTKWRTMSEVTCVMEESGGFPCPPVIQSIISLDIQTWATWNHTSYLANETNPRSGHLFVAARMKIEEKTIHVDYLYGYAQLSSENVKSLINGWKAHYEYSNRCNVTMTSEDNDWGRSCIDMEGHEKFEHENVISVQKLTFRRDNGMLGIKNMELVTAYTYRPDFPDGTEALHTVRTLKDGWTMSKFFSNLMAYEEQRKQMCDCMEIYRFDWKGDNDYRNCVHNVGLKEEFHPLMKRDGAPCSSDPVIRNF